MSFQNLTVLCHGRTIRDDFVFPEAEWLARDAKARELMERKNLDGLLIFAESGQTRGNVCYLTNYNQSLTWGCSMLVFPKDGEPRLLATIAPRDVGHRKPALRPFLELVPLGLKLTSNEHLSLLSISYMRENGLLEGKRWGTVNIAKMPQAVADPWREVYPDGMPDCTEEFGRLRAVKSKNEIYALSTASSIAKTAVFDYLRMAQPGENEMTVAADIDRLARLKGCESVSLLTYSGKDGETMLRVPWDRNFECGDTVSAFMCVSYLRYYGAYGATTVIGGRSSEQDALFAAAEEIFAKKINEMRTGSVLTGYAEGRCGTSGANYYTIVNGVGMDLCDYPDSQGESVEVLENMTFTVSLSVKNAGVGSVLISRNMLVTSDGIFPLSGFDS